MKTSLILIFLSSLILPHQTLKSQIFKAEYCSTDSTNAKNLIGRQVKIWHEGGIYPTINRGEYLKWPSNEIKQSAGENGWGTFTPKAADTGIIVHIFIDKQHNKNIYLLKIQKYYVPVDCYYVIDIDQSDLHQQAKERRIKDSIANVNYAAGCKFKIRNVNNQWSRAGSTKLDQQSEEFACDLITKGIDTVMLCKYIFDNGSLPIEKAFVLWLENGKGYVKSFFNNSKREPTNNNIQSFDSKQLIDHFFINKLDTVTSEPKSAGYLSHSMGYSIQLYTTDYFFRQRLTNFIIRQDKTHPKAIWWTMVSDNLAMLKEEQQQPTD